ncbi:MAG TPA: phosphoglycerate dehydrogenase [Candidatus Thiothrix moscowensis]|uniref:phosphoglycerate dehydrogenase n=1 Tax=unclassified Thiothrix TaxID=2636184 RepID=UPI001A3622AB|nr:MULTISPECIES: phosphoglycerate dehydrogenase [unclassified Thiothrix]MBJ6611635.1 phosphoglycerate dehydrogenase [Candidatus Thiothrix moscowensis]HRJ53731.1 phosphoglycerate dehydrogenase [Candidatus Thiothrix moscowensis]HRJ93813.1 phosphoglycerate dehydrogenase [Candidatus Thiothrix moscowensis]
MYKIQTLNTISAKGLNRLPADRYNVSDNQPEADAILLRSFKLHDYPFSDNLLAVARAGSGTNNVPIAALSEKGVVVFNAPGANSNAVKELVIAGMLMACRNISPALNFVRNLQGTDEEILVNAEKGKKNFSGFELPGRTLGVVGLGAIGVRIANAARSLGMNVIGYDPTITIERAWQLDADVEAAPNIDTLLAQADFITFHVPLIDSTRNLINADSLHKLKDGVVLLNFARNGILDDSAVLAGLESGKVYAYVCDFPSNLLRTNPRVVALPHLGATTREAEENCAIMVADQVRDYLENGNICNSVNLPNVKLRRTGLARIAVVNRNNPDMLGKISHVLGQAGVNIAHMLNDSKGNMAYTLMDVDSAVGDDTLAALAAIPGVLKVRLL